MKFSYKHIKENIKANLQIDELSDKLFQLGHEHEINNEIFDMEFTPNRGDCLSIRGLLRDLKLFHDINENNNIYKKEINPFKFKFINNVSEICKNISFLYIEIEDLPSEYFGPLKNYFDDLNIKKNNFFTDVSNYISYETGQPTHCYDSSKIKQPIKLDFNKADYDFNTLLKKRIVIKDKDLVFFDKDGEIINLAGVIGGEKTACNNKSKSVIIECAYFDPEVILGQTLKYGINSDAAYKFERNTDPDCHDYVLRRFIQIVAKHTNINKIELFSCNTNKLIENKILFDMPRINKILGTDLENKICIEYLTKLGFTFEDDFIHIPSYRNDICTINDISEEVARAFGYDNIKTKKFNISKRSKKETVSEENKLKKLLVDIGFYEIINNPFVSNKNDDSIVVDNPLDSNKNFLRTNLKNSLLQNLIYNERRQQDIIKLFEISDIYYSKSGLTKKVCGIIASGRVAKNFKDFNKKIDNNYLENLLKPHIKNTELSFQNISRDLVDSKIKNSINYLEIEINDDFLVDYQIENQNIFDIHNKQHTATSDFPFSKRDLSFSVKDFSNCKILEEYILNFNHELLKDVFVFDYFENEKVKEIKIGFRFIFQSKTRTITDDEVNNAMDAIISNALNIQSVSIPGL